jgi:threonylcarbamoyladenosine tRNA methylthiotransferase MtaB
MRVAHNLDKNTITIALETLGCKLNQAETELLCRQLAAAGYKIVSTDQPSDVYILNTCTVTHVADSKSRHLLRKAHRRNPDCRLIALGCYGQTSRSEISRIEGVALVLDNIEKSDLPKYLERWYGAPSDPSEIDTLEPGRTRSFIKAQDGCNNFCSYCIVPLVRGREKSLPAQEAIGQIRQRVKEGYREVVLTGTEIGRYRFENLGLAGLLDLVLKETGVARLRLSSLQPQEITGEILALWQDPRLCRHFHLSLQSGSTDVLNRMNRRYTAEDYVMAVDSIRRQVPGAAITTDIIAGFPGETEEEFEESLDFCRGIRFSRIHVFPYSRREGTKACDMEGQVGELVKRERCKRMLSLAKEALLDFNQRFSGAITPVLFEQELAGFWSGLTDNYIRVVAKSTRCLTNQVIEVRIGKVRGQGMEGEIIG